MSDTNKFEKFGVSEHGNFKIIDTIGVPHPYCITPKHLKYANMFIGEAEIKEAEKNGVYCDICVGIERKGGKRLTYQEHKQALLVECAKDPNENPTYEQELRTYLLRNKELCEAENYAGFAFIKKTETPSKRTKKRRNVPNRSK